METLRAAYEMAKRNDGAPGIDGVRRHLAHARKRRASTGNEYDTLGLFNAYRVRRDGPKGDKPHAEHVRG